MIPEDQKNMTTNDEVRGDILQPPHRHLTPAVVSYIKLKKGKNLNCSDLQMPYLAGLCVYLAKTFCYMKFFTS